MYEDIIGGQALVICFGFKLYIRSWNNSWVELHTNVRVFFIGHIFKGKLLSNIFMGAGIGEGLGLFFSVISVKISVLQFFDAASAEYVWIMCFARVYKIYVYKVTFLALRNLVNSKFFRKSKILKPHLQ